MQQDICLAEAYRKILIFGPSESVIVPQVIESIARSIFCPIPPSNQRLASLLCRWSQFNERASSPPPDGTLQGRRRCVLGTMTVIGLKTYNQAREFVSAKPECEQLQPGLWSRSGYGRLVFCDLFCGRLGHMLPVHLDIFVEFDPIALRHI